MTSPRPGVLPKSTQFEVSVFGPGKGEAIAVHLGGGDWVTVDSCVDQTSGKNALLAYFSSIGVAVEDQVKLVIGTHPHDDHIAGISDLYMGAKSARFITSSALNAPEFFAEVEADRDIEEQIGQAVRTEYRNVLAEVQLRGRGRSGIKLLRYASEQRELWERPATNTLPAARVTALSPSDEAIRRSLKRLAEGTAQAGHRKRLRAGDPNESSVALWIEFGTYAVLLGSDLLSGPVGCGWSGVLSSHSPAARASVHKVPHHGSPNAHHPGVWTDLLTEDVISVLAPFRPGPRPRPDDQDKRRIIDRSSAAFATAQSRLPAMSRPTKRARASLQGIAQNIREPWGQLGQVRARIDTDQNLGVTPWAVETFAPAYRL